MVDGRIREECASSWERAMVGEVVKGKIGREKMRSRKKHPDSCDAPNYHATTIVTIFAEGHDAALTHGPRSSKSE